MFKIIFEVVMLIILIAVFASYQSAANVRGTMRMSVTLPGDYVNHPEVLAVINRFKKYNRLLFLIFVAATLPMYIIPYTSFILLYFSLWIAAVFLVSSHLYNRYNGKLYLMKSNNLWFVKDGEYDVFTSEDLARTRGKWAQKFRKYFPAMIDRLLAQCGGKINADEDIYWLGGSYCNPSDHRNMVEKRVGAGSTMNMAKRSGKIVNFLTAVFITIVLGGIFILFVRMDFAEFHMNITDKSISINAPMYDYDFQIGDIKSITLSDTLPKHGSRTNGAATDQYYLGHFNFTEYGDSMVYLYPDYPPYIIIRLQDKTVMFNTKSAAKTKGYYNELSEKSKQ